MGRIWKVVRWLLAGTGAVAVLLIAGALLWGGNATDTAWIGNDQQGCDFGFALRPRRWVTDDVTGSNALVRANERPAIYLFGQKDFKPNAPGEWFITVDSKCRIEPRKVLRGRDGGAIPTYLASACQAGPENWPQFRQADYLYAQVPAAQDIHIIYMSAGTPAQLLSLEDEFQRIAASYRAPDADCPWKKQR